MSIDNLDANAKQKLSQFMDGALKVHAEIDDLKEGLRETTKALADELDIKPAVINKAIRAAKKANIHDERDNLDTVEAILVATGRG